MPRSVRVLYIGANPPGLEDIQVRDELEAFRDLKNDADRFEVEDELLAQTNSLRRAILSAKPQIIHIAAHGTESDTIVLGASGGKQKEVSAAALGGVIEHLNPRPRLVVITACRTQNFAASLLSSVNCVLGYLGTLPTDVALDFVRTFYEQLLQGDSVEDAYDQSLSNIALNHDLDVAAQFYLKGEREDPDDVVFFPRENASRASRLVTTAFIVQPIGDKESPERERARRIYRKLIKPVCRGLGMHPVRAHKLHTSSVKEPIVSSLHTSRLVIADIGASPWNPNVMTEVGFRLANGRPIVFVTDEKDDSKLPVLLKGMRIIRTDDGAEALEAQCQEALRVSRGWESSYPTVEIAVYDDRNLALAEYTSANQPALELYHCAVEDIVGRLCQEVDGRIAAWMPPDHLKAFDEEQVELLQKCLVPAGRGQEVRATRPLWFTEQHPSDRFKNTFHWPVLTQKRVGEPNKVTVLRVIFVNITDWMRPLFLGDGAMATASLPADFRPHEYLPVDVLFVHNDPDEHSAIPFLKYALGEFELRGEVLDGDQCKDLKVLKARAARAKLIALVIGSERLPAKVQENIAAVLSESPTKPVVVAHSMEWSEVEEEYPELAASCNANHYPYFKFRVPGAGGHDASGLEPVSKMKRILKCVSSLLRQELATRKWS